jgi:hypothetical protein
MVPVRLNEGLEANRAYDGSSPSSGRKLASADDMRQLGGSFSSEKPLTGLATTPKLFDNLHLIPIRR